jgi:hypothetical protein
MNSWELRGCRRTQRIKSEDLRDACDGACGESDIEGQGLNKKRGGSVDVNRMNGDPTFFIGRHCLVRGVMS